MGNQVEKLRQRELARRSDKMDKMASYLHGNKRRQSVMETTAAANQDEAMIRNPTESDRLQGLGLHAAGEEGDETADPRHLTDREREYWLYRMENEALDVINDNMELQEERRRERERRDERREELENLGADTGMGYFDHGDLGREDPTMNREDLYPREDRAEDDRQQDEQQEQASRPSSPRSSGPPSSVSNDESIDDDDDDDFDDDDDADDDAFSEQEDDQDDDFSAPSDAEEVEEPDDVDEPEPEAEAEAEAEAGAADDDGGRGGDD